MFHREEEDGLDPTVGAVDPFEPIPIPEDYCCPITLELIEDPVVAADKYSYERAAFIDWIKRGNKRSPKDGSLLLHTNFTPNQALKTIIQDFKEKMPQLQKEKHIRVDLDIQNQLREQFIRGLLEKANRQSNSQKDLEAELKREQEKSTAAEMALKEEKLRVKDLENQLKALTLNPPSSAPQSAISNIPSASAVSDPILFSASIASTKSSAPASSLVFASSAMAPSSLSSSLPSSMTALSSPPYLASNSLNRARKDPEKESKIGASAL